MRKKGIFLLALIFVILLLNGCNRVTSLTLEQSKKNFEFYKGEISDICRQNNIILKTDNNDKSSIEFTLQQSGASYIEILIQNSSFNDNLTGREDFEIYCFAPTTEQYDVELIVEIVNAISGKGVSKEFCMDFVTVHNDKYCIEKSSEQVINKYHFLDFGENWSIGYTEYKWGEKELIFWGLTKTGCNQGLLP